MEEIKELLDRDIVIEIMVRRPFEPRVAASKITGLMLSCAKTEKIRKDIIIYEVKKALKDYQVG